MTDFEQCPVPNCERSTGRGVLLCWRHWRRYVERHKRAYLRAVQSGSDDDPTVAYHRQRAWLWYESKPDGFADKEIQQQRKARIARAAAADTADTVPTGHHFAHESRSPHAKPPDAIHSAGRFRP